MKHFLSPGKLNLYLHISGRRTDGYHLLDSLFAPVSRADTLSVCTDAADLSLQIQGSEQLSLEALETNLVIMAAALLKQLALTHSGLTQGEINALGARMVLKKTLPLGGGMGGGSSNAATALVALNQLWKLNLPIELLLEKSVSLGADVPFFVAGQAAHVTGVGETLRQINLHSLLGKQTTALVLTPKAHISTKDLFADPKLQRHTKTAKLSQYSPTKPEFTNVFTPLVLARSAAVAKAHDYLAKQQLSPKLTGTGACVFALLSDSKQGEQLLKNAPCPGFVCSLDQCSEFYTQSGLSGPELSLYTGES